MKNTSLAFVEGKTSRLKIVNDNLYKLNISGISNERPVIVFKDRPQRESSAWTVDQYINYLNTGSEEGIRNLVLKYFSNEKNREIELAFTVKSIAKNRDGDSIELVLKTSPSQKIFNADHINNEKISEHVGIQPQLYVGTSIDRDPNSSNRLLTLLQSSEVKIKRVEDKSLKIVMEGTDLNTLAFNSGKDAQVRNIETWILPQEWPGLFAESAPNALLSYQLENHSESQQIVFSMNQPIYDQDNNTFEFIAKQSTDQERINDNTILDYDDITGFGLFNNTLKTTTEIENGTLFIDDIISPPVPDSANYISVKVHNDTKENLTVLSTNKGLAGFDNPFQENIPANGSTEELYGLIQNLPGGLRFSVGADVKRSTGVSLERIELFWVTMYEGFMAYFQWASVELGNDKMWSEAYNAFYNLSKTYKGSKTLYDNGLHNTRVPVVYDWKVVFEKGIPTDYNGWHLPTNIYISGGEPTPPL
jgi:hypothetical protein